MKPVREALFRCRYEWCPLTTPVHTAVHLMARGLNRAWEVDRWWVIRDLDDHA